MMSGNQCPNLTPSPWSFLGLEGENYLDYPHLLAILHYPFCHRLFEPTWDYKFAFCKHAYHSLCVISHFSTSIKCLFEGCGQEMRSDWWVLSGILKPFIVEDAIPGIDWITTIFICNNFDGEFNLRPFSIS